MKKFFSVFLIPFVTVIIHSQDFSTYTDDYRSGQEIKLTTVNWSPITDAAGEWCPSSAFPVVPTATYFQEATWLGDTLYLHAPPLGGPTATVYKYTIGGSWTTGVPLPVSIVGGTLTSCNGKLYYIGGSLAAINGTAVNTVYEYDPSTGAWTIKAPMPAALAGHGAVSWGDSVIFVVGGPYTGSGTNLNVHYYRLASNTWGTITNSLPAGQGRRTFAIGIYSNKIVISSGFNTAFLKSTYIGTIGSNASQITWVAGPSVPTPWVGLSRPGGTAVDKYFFLVSGELGGSPTTWRYGDTTYVMDIILETWVDIVDNIPFNRSNICNGVAGKIVDDSIKIYVPGGYGSVTGGTPGAGTDQFDAIACGDLIFIPVELTSFIASVNGTDVRLDWRTVTELNNSGFEVERNSGAGYTKIGFVAGVGNATEPILYSFTDANLRAGKYIYRLKQIDYDGSFEYSQAISVEVITPAVFNMEQNYPNPFNPSTTIAFSLATDSKVSLKIFNALGQEVTILINENMSEGFHEKTFNASNLNSGVYFYKIEATGADGQSFTQVRKMILTK
jgi:hypothetical protein